MDLTKEILRINKEEYLLIDITQRDHSKNNKIISS